MSSSSSTTVEDCAKRSLGRGGVGLSKAKSNEGCESIAVLEGAALAGTQRANAKKAAAAQKPAMVRIVAAFLREGISFPSICSSVAMINLPPGCGFGFRDRASQSFHPSSRMRGNGGAGCEEGIQGQCNVIKRRHVLLSEIIQSDVLQNPCPKKHLVPYEGNLKGEEVLNKAIVTVDDVSEST